MNGLDFEDVVIVADEVCAVTGAEIRSYAALAAVAAMSHARLRGVSVHSTPTARDRCITEGVRSLNPLSSHNTLLATTLIDVLSDHSIRL